MCERRPLWRNILKEFEFTAEGAQIANLLSMTPHFWRISQEGAKRLQATTTLTDTASCVVNVYRPQ